MSESKELQTMGEANIVKAGDNLEVTASTPTQLADCQMSMIDWMKAKIERVKSEITAAQADAMELHSAYDYAVKQKWRKDTLYKHWQKAEGLVKKHIERLEYYHKLLTALENGYYIVPPMECELFAIRTEKAKPSRMWYFGAKSRHHNFEQGSQILPEGGGDYKNPQPHIFVDYGNDQKNEKTGEIERPFWADQWNAVEFPLNMVKPRIMEATSRAMTLKVFDEIGVLPQDYRRNPDPVIIGRIYDPTKKGWGRQHVRGKAIHFMIAWHLNTKDL